MTRTEALTTIASNAAQLDDDQLTALAKYTAYLTGPTIYSTLPQTEKKKIKDALVPLDRGEHFPAEDVFAELEAKIAAARHSA